MLSIIFCWLKAAPLLVLGHIGDYMILLLNEVFMRLNLHIRVLTIHK